MHRRQGSHITIRHLYTQLRAGPRGLFPLVTPFVSLSSPSTPPPGNGHSAVCAHKSALRVFSFMCCHCCLFYSPRVSETGGLVLVRLTYSPSWGPLRTHGRHGKWPRVFFSATTQEAPERLGGTVPGLVWVALSRLLVLSSPPCPRL